MVGFPVTRLRVLAGAQVARALAGTRLSSVASAEDIGAFWQTATRSDEARYKAAYWMAVASRLLGSRGLAVQAAARLAQPAVLPSGAEERVSSIYGRAVDAISRVVGVFPPPEVRRVLAALGRMAERPYVAAERKRRFEASVPGIVAGAVKQTTQEMNPWIWFSGLSGWQKVAVASGVALASIVALGWIFRPAVRIAAARSTD